MSEDLISRQAAIIWVKTECNPYGKPTIDFESGKKVIKHLEQLPSAQPEPQWIPCSERLPEDSRDVIIFTASGVIGIGSFIRTSWFQWYSGGGLPVDVTHWMPLPDAPEVEG